MLRSLSLTALDGLPLVHPGDDVGELVSSALRRSRIAPASGDIVVVTQKIVSKAEGRFVDLDGIVPSARARTIAEHVGKDPRLVEVILSESTDVIRYGRDVLIVAHRLGFITANAGVDQSNVGPDGHEWVLLLPQDPDASAACVKQRLDSEFGVAFGVIVSDSFGRPWRNGTVGVAIGAAGVPALVNLVGERDLFGRRMRRTQVALADQVASAAALLMGECDEGIPAVHVRGVRGGCQAVPASVLIRSAETDLFR